VTASGEHFRDLNVQGSLSVTLNIETWDDTILYRGRFVDYENTFDTTEEPDHFEIGVLQSKEWFEGDDITITFGGHSPYFPHSILLS
jgi:hypothetical protein